MKIKRCIRHLFSFLMLFVCFLLLVFPAFAAENAAVAELTVSQSYLYPTGAAPKNATLSYRLTAVDLDGDKPEPDNEYVPVFSLTGTESRTVALPFSEPGVYRFTLQPVIGKEAKNYTYDKRVYQITVYVKYLEQKLVPTVVVADESGNKLSSIEYRHRYQPPANIPETGDSADMTSWLLAAVGSLIVLAGLLAVAQKRRQNSKESGGDHYE